MSEYKKSALVCGAGGFIGSHMVKRLISEGYWVRGVDLKYPEFSSTQAQEFIIGDLTNPDMAYQAVYGVDEVYQFAADMGGAGYIFTGEHDADVMNNSALINLNILSAIRDIHFKIKGSGKVIEQLEKNEAIDKKLLRHLTVRVKKFDLDTNYFSKNEESEKTEKKDKLKN